MKLCIDSSLKEAIYKQIILQIENGVRSGAIAPGEMLPSMNELAGSLGISRETVKKAYGILAERGIIEPIHGKGFFTADPSLRAIPKVLVLFDKLSVYKQLLYNSFLDTLGKNAEVTIFTHNQEVKLLEYYLDQSLDHFDYYVVTPHFPLEEKVQEKARRQLSRIPNRKLILLDRLMPGFPGNYGAVYQDFENDLYEVLSEGLQGGLFQNCHLKVITLPESLYGEVICAGVKRFCSQYNIPVSFYDRTPEDITQGDTFIIINSQLDEGIVDLSRRIRERGLEIGSQVKLISYNEFSMNELVLGGLTTVSANFREMGRMAADMIISRRLSKIHCPFSMTKRRTF